VKKANTSETMVNQRVALHLAKINANAVAIIAMEKNHADVAAIAVIVTEHPKVIVANN
jgi:hypothetical protein